MSDRLKDLQRQRALAQEQLAWIDAEIAKEGGAAPAPSQPVASAVPAPARPASAAEAARMADEILARYKDPRGEADGTKSDVKRGCYVYFVLAFVIVAVGVISLYFYSAGKH